MARPSKFSPMHRSPGAGVTSNPISASWMFRPNRSSASWRGRSWRMASPRRATAHPTRLMPSSSSSGFSLDHCFTALNETRLTPLSGKVVRAVGLLIESQGPHARVGEICEVVGAPGDDPRSVEVVGFQDGKLLSVPLGDTAGVRPGARIVARGRFASVAVGRALLGRVVDAFGRPIDGRGPIRAGEQANLYRGPVNPLSRQPICAPLGTGVRAIDALLTCGRGQRVGLFGGSGVGKSTLLGMMARGTAADVVVLALVGERGREVR